MRIALGITVAITLALACAAARPRTMALTVSICPSHCLAKVGQAFTLAADHDGANTATYVVYVNGAKSGELPVSALQPPGVISFAFTKGLSRGTYTLLIAAVTAGGSEARSAALDLSVTPSGR